VGFEGEFALSVIQAIIIGMIVHSLIHRSHGMGHQH